MWEIWVWSLGVEDPWRKEWPPTPVFLHGEFQWQKSLAGHSPWDPKELDMTEWLSLHSCIAGRFFFFFLFFFFYYLNYPYPGTSGEEFLHQCRRCQRCQFDPWSGRSSGVGNHNLLQYSCLENSMDRGAWRATVHGVTERWTWLSTHNTHTSLLQLCPCCLPGLELRLHTPDNTAVSLLYYCKALITKIYYGLL